MLEFMRPETLSGGHDPAQVQHSLQAKYRGELWCSSCLYRVLWELVALQPFVCTAHRVSCALCIVVFSTLTDSRSFCLPRAELLLLCLSSVHVAEAVAMEQHSLHSVYQLVVMCCECVALWRVLCEGNMNLTAGKLGAVSEGGKESGEESGKREGRKGREVWGVGRGEVRGMGRERGREI